MMPLRVVIMDGNDISRHGLEVLVKQRAEWQIVGAVTAPDGVLPLLETGVDVLLLDDANLSTWDVTPFITSLRRSQPSLKVIVVSHHLVAPYIEALIQAGVAGYVFIEDRVGKRLTRALELALEGELYLSPRALLLSYSFRPALEAEHLNEREWQVLRMLHEGLTVQESAARLGVSDAAIYRARRKLRTVLHVRTNEQIVEAALRRGLLVH